MNGTTEWRQLALPGGLVLVAVEDARGEAGDHPKAEGDGNQGGEGDNVGADWIHEVCPLCVVVAQEEGRGTRAAV